MTSTVFLTPSMTPSLASPQTDLFSDDAWRSVLVRDARADGRFVYAVATTGIFCRPTCPGRRPHRHNVRFFATPEEAQAAGFRPCLRCRPDEAETPDPQLRSVRRTAARLAQPEAAPRASAALARSFERVLGVTPSAFARAKRIERFRAEVSRPGTSVTDALYEAGFGSGSRLYERSAETLGMTPTALKRGGRGERIVYALADSPLGRMLVARTTRGVCAIAFADTPDELVEDLHARFPAADLTPMDDQLRETVEAVAATLGENPRALTLPLDIRATAFQLRVWNALRQIPRGETRTYTEVAEAIGSPTSVRAVAAACAANPVALAIPCHRVVGKDGSLTGFRWGVQRKRALLRYERSATPARAEQDA